MAKTTLLFIFFNGFNTMIRLLIAIIWIKNIKVAEPAALKDNNRPYAKKRTVKPIILVCLGFFFIHFSKSELWYKAAFLEV